MMTCSLPTDPAKRAEYPMADGLLDYFSNALAEVSRLSKIANDQHNPGQPMHWSRGKSTDHANKIVKHLIDRSKFDTDGIRHSAKVAWRALAMLQEELEQDEGYPMPRNAWVDAPPPDYDPSSVAFTREDVSRAVLQELVRETEALGLYDQPAGCNGAIQPVSPIANTSAKTAHDDKLRADVAWSVKRGDYTLADIGIGDVRPVKDHRRVATPAELAYLASFSPNPHPMAAEALRDEYNMTSQETGV